MKKYVLVFLIIMMQVGATNEMVSEKIVQR